MCCHLLCHSFRALHHPPVDGHTLLLSQHHVCFAALLQCQNRLFQVRSLASTVSHMLNCSRGCVNSKDLDFDRCSTISRGCSAFLANLPALGDLSLEVIPQSECTNYIASRVFLVMAAVCSAVAMVTQLMAAFEIVVNKQLINTGFLAGIAASIFGIIAMGTIVSVKHSLGKYDATWQIGFYMLTLGWIVHGLSAFVFFQEAPVHSYSMMSGFGTSTTYSSHSQPLVSGR